VETNEFPDTETIAARMKPLCYEEGVLGGYSDGTPQYMNSAAEIYMKELLTQIFSSTRSNGAHWVQTAAFKKRFKREERLANTGEVQRSPGGLLPVELEQERIRRPLGLVDIKLGRQLNIGGGRGLGSATMALRFFEADGIDDEETARDAAAAAEDALNLRLTNGINGAGPMHAPPRPEVNGTLTNGVHKEEQSEEDFGWSGGINSDQSALDDSLDICLSSL
jgi:transcriptional coactivator HFI1/ADA1